MTTEYTQDVYEDFKERIRAAVSALYDGQQLSDENLYEVLMSVGYSGLEGPVLDEFATLSERTRQTMLRALYEQIGPKESIVTFPEDSPLWLRVTRYVEKRLPSDSISDQLWIRLETIEQVIPKPGIAIGDDSRDYQFVLQVMAKDIVYDVTAVRFKGGHIQDQVQKVMSLVTNAVRNSNRLRL